MVKSDGGSTTYYDIPEGARDIGDLIDYRQMSFGVGNIFKACYRIGQKDGIDPVYDLKKIIWMAERELEYVERRREAETAAAKAAKFGGEGPALPPVQAAGGALEEEWFKSLDMGQGF